MTKDGKPYELTKEEALRLHREMWADMQKELGDKPNLVERARYKNDWIEKHGCDGVQAACFLCEYAQQAWWANYRTHGQCDYCPIDWSFLSCGLLSNSCFGRYRKGGGEVYQYAPISEILALPQKEAK